MKRFTVIGIFENGTSVLFTTLAVNSEEAIQNAIDETGICSSVAVLAGHQKNVAPTKPLDFAWIPEK